MGALLVAAVVVFFLMRHQQISASVSGFLGAGGASLGLGVQYAPVGPLSDPRYWYQGIKPGTVTIAGEPAPNSWQPGHAAETGLNTAAMAVQAVPVFGQIAGVALKIASSIVHMLGAHHRAALAAEGKALNDADPRAMNAFVLVLQAVLAGEISDVETARAHLDTIVSDWYGEVRTVQRGTWHYTAQDFAANQTYENSWKAGAPGVHHTQDALRSNWPPDPCNAACVMGHYFVERARLVVLDAVNDALGGMHGEMVLPAIPPHQTQSGLAEVRMVY